tara:strand:- start:143 stop:658 length:516 start_codon:yes stop_codon:yes gene_type:complete
VSIYYSDGSNSGAGRIVQYTTSAYDGKFSQDIQSAYHSNDAMTLAITPKTNDSVIWCTGTLNVAVSGQEQCGLILVRDSTVLDGYRGSSDGNRGRHGASSSVTWANGPTSIPLNYVDNPATTSAVTYRVRLISAHGGGGNRTVWLNRTSDDSNETYRPRTRSTMTLFEITV